MSTTTKPEPHFLPQEKRSHVPKYNTHFMQIHQGRGDFGGNSKLFQVQVPSLLLSHSFDFGHFRTCLVGRRGVIVQAQSSPYPRDQALVRLGLGGWHFVFVGTGGRLFRPGSDPVIEGLVERVQQQKERIVATVGKGRYPIERPSSDS